MSWNYKREETKSRINEGNHRVEIVEVEEGVSKSSGSPMITVTIRPNLSDIKLKYYLVKGPHFNRNATSFFDSFDIEEGDFEMAGWVGALGAVRLVRDERNPRYLRVGWLIPRDEAIELPPWEGPLPERQKVIDGNTFVQVDDDDSPF